jgi:hypothetical protein
LAVAFTAAERSTASETNLRTGTACRALTGPGQ